MTITAQKAAMTISELADWKISNLRLQKMMYICHMFYLGRTGEPLIDEAFEAWDYGPVLPSIYHRLKGFGADDIVDVFTAYAAKEDTPEYKLIAEIVGKLNKLTSGRLVDLTHKEAGAWAKHYIETARGIIIPNTDIQVEYHTYSDNA